MERNGTRKRKTSRQETQSTKSISKQSADLNTEWLEKKCKRHSQNTKSAGSMEWPTCTQLAGLNGGRIGDIARGIGGTLVSPPETLNIFVGSVELLRVVHDGVPAKPNHHKQTLRRRYSAGITK